MAFGAAAMLALAVIRTPDAAAREPAPREPAKAQLGPLAERTSAGEGRVILKIAQPTVRIGLSGNGRAVTLSSMGGLHIVDRETGQDAWKHLHRGVVRVVLEKGGDPADAAVFQVQVASLASREEAESLKARLESETGEAVRVIHHPDRGSWRVRVGQRATREEIALVEERLRELGYAEIWVVQEAAEGGRSWKMRLVDEDYNDLLTSSRGLLVLPAEQGGPVTVEEIPYRGAVEVLLTRGRELRAVNVINREEYLRGVVPKEMGPTVYPELEALEAQAIAARTYIQANLGQFDEDGFDICDTARCQVYGGIAAEHPLTDFAVQQTADIIATYQGRPINALYTSTCGGHTEDLKNVFREMEGPYLKAVPCYAEEETLAGMRRSLKGAWTGPPSVLPGGERIDVALAMLEVLGALTPEEATAEHMAGTPTADEAGRWTTKTLKALGKRPPGDFRAARDLADQAQLAAYLVEAFGWSDRLEQLLDPRDLPVFLEETALASAPERLRRALAYMVKEGILPRPRPAAAGGPEPVSRGHLARALHRMVLRYGAEGLVAAKYRGARAEELGMQSEGTLEFHPVAPRLHLIVRDGSDSMPVAQHPLQNGDNVEYHLSAGGAIDYLLLKANDRGASDDRYSAVHTWAQRVPREELEQKIKERASIGRLVDLVPGRRGASGRLIDLKVVGTAGRFTFKGFDIERLLGLRETLFLVDRQFDDEGRVETFIFTGKGWGHGVGMCQVGAYGMALRGRTHEEILRHYYTGIALQKAGSR